MTTTQGPSLAGEDRAGVLLGDLEGSDCNHGLPPGIILVCFRNDRHDNY